MSRHQHVLDLTELIPHRYTYGINFRAYVAYLAGIAINVVGFAGASMCCFGFPAAEILIYYQLDV